MVRVPPVALGISYVLYLWLAVRATIATYDGLNPNSDVILSMITS